MKVKDMKSILASNKFDNAECNFKLKSKGPKAPEWFKGFYTNEFKPLQQAFIDSQTKAPHWFKEFYTNEFKPLQQAFIDSQTKVPEWFKQWSIQFEQKINERFDKLEKRLDNIVAKNNLKE